MNIFIKAKQANHLSLMRKKGRNKIHKVLLQKYYEHDSVQDKQMLLKLAFYGMLWYAMQCNAILWYSMESVV